MAKKSQEQDNSASFHIPGVSNYEKLRANSKVSKKNQIHNQDVFGGGSYSAKAAKNSETEAVDPRYVDEDIYYQQLLQNLHNQVWRKNAGSTNSLFTMEPKRRRLRLQSLASYDRLDEVLTKITDELIVDGTNDSWPIKAVIDRLALEAAGIKESVINELEKKADEHFIRLYHMFGFSEEGSKRSLWNQVYEFMVEGSKAFELIFDDITKPKKVIGVAETDALSVTDFYRRGVRYWVHKRELSNHRKEQSVLLYDSQIVKIDWSATKVTARCSYLEGLIRSFNTLRIMDETRVLWAVTNSQFRTIFSIPTGGLSRIKAAQTLATEMSRYHDDIEYDSDTGSLTTNGQPQLKFQKEYWLANGDQGTPTVDTVGGDGPDLNDPQINEYFARIFYRNSRIPFSRFDGGGGADTWNVDPQSQYREEISFGRFINRVRIIFSHLLLKPLLIQLELDMPDIKNDKTIQSAIKIHFESYAIFEELSTMSMLKEKIEFIQTMRDSLQTSDIDGNDLPLFSQRWLVEKYLPEFTAEDMELNEKYRGKEIKWMHAVMKQKAKLADELSQIYDPENPKDGTNDEFGKPEDHVQFGDDEKSLDAEELAKKNDKEEAKEADKASDKVDAEAEEKKSEKEDDDNSISKAGGDAKSDVK